MDYEAACAGSEKAKKKKRARSKQKKNRKPDDEKPARAGSEEEEKALRKPVPISFGTSIWRPKDEEAWAGKRRKKVTMRLDKELVECFALQFIPPPFEPPFPSLHPGSVERQERFNAILKAEHEQRDGILRQYEELGYAEVEFEVPDDDEDEGGAAGIKAGK